MESRADAIPAGITAARAGVRPILSVEELTVWFETSAGISKVVDGVSLAMRAGDILAVVGESGSGKSVTVLSMVGLLGVKPAHLSGRVEVDGVDMLALNEKELRRRRGRIVALMLQNPRASLDPSYTVGAQMVETLLAHRLVADRAEASRRARHLLASMQFDDVERVFNSYRHQLSGGMCQRVLLALTLACEPKVLIVDEPTASLDMAVQHQVLAQLRQLNENSGLPILIITHDFGVVRKTATHVLVMYAGHVQEEGDCAPLMADPLHPYTQALLRAIPSADRQKGTLQQIPGEPPQLVAPQPGCRFADRCDRVMDVCRTRLPLLAEVRHGRRVRCHLYPASSARAA